MEKTRKCRNPRRRRKTKLIQNNFKSCEIIITFWFFVLVWVSASFTDSLYCLVSWRREYLSSRELHKLVPIFLHLIHRQATVSFIFTYMDGCTWPRPKIGYCPVKKNKLRIYNLFSVFKIWYLVVIRWWRWYKENTKGFIYTDKRFQTAFVFFLTP